MVMEIIEPSAPAGIRTEVPSGSVTVPPSGPTDWVVPPELLLMFVPLDPFLPELLPEKLAPPVDLEPALPLELLPTAPPLVLPALET
jgi:hypothetical protein